MDGDRLAGGAALEEEFTMQQGYISVQPTVRIREEALTGGSTDYILCFKSAGVWHGRRSSAASTKNCLCSWKKIIGKPLIKKVRRSYRLPDGAAGGEPCGRGLAHSVLVCRGGVPHGGSSPQLAAGSLRPCGIPQR